MTSILSFNFCKQRCFFCLLFYSQISFAQTWREINPLRNIFNDAIYSIAADSLGNIYAAGKFKNESFETIVAKLNGSNWEELKGANSNLKANNIIASITVDKKGILYAAGSFTDNTGKYSIAKWDGTAWSEVGGATTALNPNGNTYTLCTDNAGNLYAAGEFTNTAGKQYVAKWNGSNWSELGNGINSLNANDAVYALTTDDSGYVYAAGRFKNVNGKNFVAKWDGIKWIELGLNTPLNADDNITCLASDKNGYIYAGGSFRNNSGDYYVAKWDQSSWSEVGAGPNALKANGPIITIGIKSSGNIYVGGLGTNGNGATSVSEWNGNSWNEIFNVGYFINNAIRSIALDPNGNVWTAGDFKNNGGHYAVIKWDGQKSTEPGRFGDDLQAHNGIARIAVDSRGEVYITGNFNHPGGFSYIKHWNGKTWKDLGGDTASLDLISPNVGMATDKSGNLYVTGYFKNQDGKYYIAKWDGHSWSELGNPTHPLKIYEPTTLMTSDRAGNIYVAGAIGDENGFSYGIIKWDGSDWYMYPYSLGSPSCLFVDTIGNVYAGNSTRDPNDGYYYVEKITQSGVTRLGNGLTALKSATVITAIAVDSKGNVLVSGLNNAGFSPYNKFVAKWDGTNWSTAGADNGGPYSEGYVNSMLADDSGYVYAASATESNSKFTVAKWNGNEWNELGSGSNKLNANSSIGPLAIDIKGNIYAAGLFNNSNSMNYVALYGKSALLLEQPIITSISDQLCTTAGLQKIKILNLTNNSWISTRVMLDNISLPIGADSSLTFNPSTLPIGRHSLTVTFSTYKDSMFALKNFTISTPIVPDVTINASTTTVISLDPVTITAINTTGGNTAPTFLFAKDRNFTTILQAESTNNILNLNPALLAIGDNWIYVQMRTNEPCYTTPTSIDSIKINRSAITGIRDIDYPNQEIIVHPVPFNEQFFITGLQTSKTYKIVIYTSAGQLVFDNKFSNNNRTTIHLPTMARGNLWVTIYDISKKRRLGTIPVIRQ